MSLEMLSAARSAGVTSIVCTPHCREPFFDYERMVSAFELLQSEVGNFPITMGFEVAYPKLMSLGIEEWAPRLSFRDSNEFLLELDTRCTERDFRDYERAIVQLQTMGYQVIIAHPERYLAVQKDISIAERLVEMGCVLQCSSDYLHGGRLGRAKRPATRMLKRGLYRYIASDAHEPKHYRYLAKALKRNAAIGSHSRF